MDQHLLKKLFCHQSPILINLGILIGPGKYCRWLHDVAHAWAYNSYFEFFMLFVFVYRFCFVYIFPLHFPITQSQLDARTLGAAKD